MLGRALPHKASCRSRESSWRAGLERWRRGPREVAVGSPRASDGAHPAPSSEPASSRPACRTGKEPAALRSSGGTRATVELSMSTECPACATWGVRGAPRARSPRRISDSPPGCAPEHRRQEAAPAKPRPASGRSRAAHPPSLPNLDAPAAASGDFPYSHGKLCRILFVGQKMVGSREAGRPRPAASRRVDTELWQVAQESVERRSSAVNVGTLGRNAADVGGTRPGALPARRPRRGAAAPGPGQPRRGFLKPGREYRALRYRGCGKAESEVTSGARRKRREPRAWAANRAAAAGNFPAAGHHWTMTPRAKCGLAGKR